MSLTDNTALAHASPGKVHMSYPCEDQPEYMPQIERVQNLGKVSANLASPVQSDEFQTTLRWIIYKIVEANKGCTYVELKKVLRGEYGIARHIIEPALSSLTSTTLLNGLTKWRNPRMKDAGAEIGIHLFVCKEESDLFSVWRDLSLSKYPELCDFSAPIIVPQRGKAANG